MAISAKSVHLFKYCINKYIRALCMRALKVLISLRICVIYTVNDDDEFGS